MSSISTIITRFSQNALKRLILLVLLAVMLPIFGTSSADAQTRKLKLYYLHTGEKATITFKKGNKFLPSGLKKINRFLRDWRRNEPTRMDPLLMDLIWEVYKKSGSRAYIHVISGYRSPKTNNMLRKRGRGVAKRSQHTLGKALDFYLPDVKLSKLRKIGLIKQVGGVGYYPRSGSPFVHMDTGRVRHWPRMTRKQLVRVFPKGKTLHVPTDGKPLPGYKQAVASINARKSGKKKIVLAKDEKKRKNFFQRLAGRGGDDDEGASASNIPAPKKVKTTAKPAAKPAIVETVPVPQKTIVTTIAAPVETPKELPPKPEPIFLANIPIPRAAPRSQLKAIVETTTAEPIVTAALETQTEPVPVDETTTTAFNVPVPVIRPNFTPDVPVQLASAQLDEPSQVDTGTNSNLQKQLLAQAKEQLRTKLGLPPRPSADVGPTFQTALLEENSNTLATRSLAPTVEKPTLQPEIISATPIDQLPDKSVLNNDSNVESSTLAPAAAVQEKAIEDTPVVPANITPTARPKLILPEEPELPQAATFDSLPVVEPDNETPQIEEPAAPVILASVPVPKQRAEIIDDEPAAIIPSAPKIANIEQDDAAPREILMASLEANEQARPVTSAPRALDELSISWSEENRTGNFVLAASLTNDAADQMRAPAYGRAAIRQLPKMVLTAGFNPTTNIQNASRFTGNAIRFQSFTRFN